MSDDGFKNTKSRILELFSELDDSELKDVEQWITSQSYRNDLDHKRRLLNLEKNLIKIGNTIKKIVPFDAEMSSENIVPPKTGEQSDCNKINTCHVDEFLYDDDEVEKLVKAGKIKRHYCLECSSRNVKELIYISHSMSRQALQYIFKVLLPKDLEDKQVLDVGSRLGAVIFGSGSFASVVCFTETAYPVQCFSTLSGFNYAHHLKEMILAYYFSNASTIVGIEMNKEFSEVQDRIINQYSMDNNRIKVVHSDVMDRVDVVTSSDIVVINILDFFVDNEKQKDMWYFFKKNINKGSYVVCNRSIEETLMNLDVVEEFLNWLSICKPNQLENEIFFNIEDCNDLYLYTVN